MSPISHSHRPPASCTYASRSGRPGFSSARQIRRVHRNIILSIDRVVARVVAIIMAVLMDSSAAASAPPRSAGASAAKTGTANPVVVVPQQKTGSGSRREPSEERATSQPQRPKSPAIRTRKPDRIAVGGGTRSPAIAAGLPDAVIWRTQRAANTPESRVPF